MKTMCYGLRYTVNALLCICGTESRNELYTTHTDTQFENAAANYDGRGSSCQKVTVKPDTLSARAETEVKLKHWIKLYFSSWLYFKLYFNTSGESGSSDLDSNQCGQ